MAEEQGTAFWGWRELGSHQRQGSSENRTSIISVRDCMHTCASLCQIGFSWLVRSRRGSWGRWVGRALMPQA